MSDLDSLAFTPGQQVQCKTRFEEVFKGEVLAFDLNSKILILKSPSSSGNSSNHDLHFLVLDSVSDVEILNEPQDDAKNEKLPNIDMKYVKVRQEAAMMERMRLIEAVGKGVSQEGVELFTEIAKKYHRPTDITWKDDVKIVVMNSVVISPPYKESDCQPISGKTPQEAVGYVKNIVCKYWESCSKQQKAAA